MAGSVLSAHSFHARRGLAWGQLALGWICAQGLLTLIPIAPPVWGVPFLLVTGGAFAVWALLGLRRALLRRPMLRIDAAGLTQGREHIPWRAVRSWRVVPSERRVALELIAGAWSPSTGNMQLLWGGGSGRSFDARLVEASLSDIVRALRQTRPDLEAPF
ncbi:MAG: hypothetical protein ACFBRM_08400 [Pikeienuella sp.]